MVKVMPAMSQALVEYMINAPPMRISVSFKKALKWLFFTVSVVKAFKDRKLSSGLVLLISVSLIGKRFFKRKRAQSSPVFNPSTAFIRELNALQPDVKHFRKCVCTNQENQVSVSNCLNISPSDKKAYFEELLEFFRKITDRDVTQIIQQVEAKISQIHPSDTPVKDEEAYSLPKQWIDLLRSTASCDTMFIS